MTHPCRPNVFNKVVSLFYVLMLQLERDQMKRDLEDTKSKMISQSHFLDLIKKKDSQTKGIIDTLTLSALLLLLVFVNLLLVT